MYVYLKHFLIIAFGEGLQIAFYGIGLEARKPVFGGLRTTAQTSLRIRTDSLFEKYHILTCYKQNFNFLASLCS